MEVGQREYKLRGGKIILYTRADDRHGLWQARLRLGTENKLVRPAIIFLCLCDVIQPHPLYGSGQKIGGGGPWEPIKQVSSWTVVVFPISPRPHGDI